MRLLLSLMVSVMISVELTIMVRCFCYYDLSFTFDYYDDWTSQTVWSCVSFVSGKVIFGHFVIDK